MVEVVGGELVPEVVAARELGDPPHVLLLPRRLHARVVAQHDVRGRGAAWNGLHLDDLVLHILWPALADLLDDIVEGLPLLAPVPAHGCGSSESVAA